MSVDLEEYFQVSNFETLIDRERWEEQPSRVNDATQSLLDLFDQYEYKATFFVLGWIAERQPHLVRNIAERGHEIACHGYHHELVYAIGAKRFRADVERAMAAIEDACGISPLGYRAPSYSITRASLWALPILQELGFRYDSSIFPVHHPRYGIPGFSRQPVRIDLGGHGSIQEFPPTTLRMGSMTLPWSGGAYLRFLPAPLFRWGFRRLVSQGDPTVLYVHPWEIDPEQPRQRVNWRIRLNHYFNLAHTRSRLEQLLAAFPFTTLLDVLDGLEQEAPLPRVRCE